MEVRILFRKFQSSLPKSLRSPQGGVRILFRKFQRRNDVRWVYRYVMLESYLESFKDGVGWNILGTYYG